MARKSRKNVEVEITTSAPSQMFFKAAAYVRLSSDDSKKRGDSLGTQRNIIENFIATSSDIRLFKLYTDNNTTGTNFERPGFQHMLMDIERGNLNCIIVKDLTRFGRNAIDAGYYLEKYLPALGVRFIAVTDGYDSLEGDGGILLPLKNIISESYALDIGRKCRAVQRQNIADGRFVGRLAPYGYDKSPTDCRKLIIDETAAEVVRQIFAWAADGLGDGEITRRLNDTGILIPSRYKQSNGLISSENNIGKEYWTKRAVTNMLTDRVYVGDMVQGKTQTVGGKQINVSPDEWITVKNTHEPIISREMFENVQHLRTLNSERDKASRRKAIPYAENIFGGKIFCAKCGYPMRRKRQNKDNVYWYRCESQHRYSKSACVQVSVREADLITEVLTLLHKQAEILCGRTRSCS